MSFVGDPFDHDVFVSYAHAERETDDPLICDWSRRLAGKLRSLLSSALNPTVDDGSKFDMFIDESSLRAGEALTPSLRQHAERSAILLVLMSPLYPKKTWCLKELGWFLDQAGKDGRGSEHYVPMRIQPLADTAWPDRLKDESGAPPVYLELADTEAGLPLDDIETAPAKDVVRKAQVQIKVRLEELRKSRLARRAKDVQPSFDRQIVYLHAHPEDREAWAAAIALLDDLAAIYPGKLPTPSEDDALLQRQREARLKELSECAGLLMLRARDRDTFDYELMSFFTDLRRFYQNTKRQMPWAIVDRVGGPLPLADRLRIPRLLDEDWPKRVPELIQPATGP